MDASCRERRLLCFTLITLVHSGFPRTRKQDVQAPVHLVHDNMTLRTRLSPTSISLCLAYATEGLTSPAAGLPELLLSPRLLTPYLYNTRLRANNTACAASCSFSHTSNQTLSLKVGDLHSAHVYHINTDSPK